MGDSRSSAQFVKWQRPFDQPFVVKIAVDQAIEDKATVEARLPPRCLGIAHDIRGATVAQQMVVLGMIREFVDLRDVDQKQAPGRFCGNFDWIEINFFAAVVCSHTDEVAFIADNVDQLELFEERCQRRETLALLPPRLDRDADRGALSNLKLKNVCAIFPGFQ